MFKHVLLTALLMPAAAAADPAEAAPRSGLFGHEPSLRFDAGAGLGLNSDDMATDFGGGHPMTSLELGYRFHTGTQPFVTAALGLGGHEAVFATYGAGVRQALQLGRLTPFVDLGIYKVGDETNLPAAFGWGVGIEALLGERVYVGASARYFASDDSDETGGLDWGGRLYLGARLGSNRR
jgi:opacity protein-like surface antigen